VLEPRHPTGPAALMSERARARASREERKALESPAATIKVAAYCTFSQSVVIAL